MSHPKSSPRPVTPRLLGSLLLAGTAATFAAPPAAMAGPALSAGPGPMVSTSAVGGPFSGARIWLAQAEGGEGGEAGAVAEAPADLAFLARLHIVEGHLRGAVSLYHQGLKDEAIGVAYHPEAEMMDEVRADLAARGLADFTPQLAAVGTAIEAGAAPEAVDAAMADLARAIATSAAPEAAEKRLRADALVLLMRAAASDYANALAAPGTIDLVPYAEAHGFVMTARDRAAELAGDADPAVAAAAQKMLAAITTAEPLFNAPAVAGDPALLLAAAARIELSASGVK